MQPPCMGGTIRWPPYREDGGRVGTRSFWGLFREPAVWLDAAALVKLAAIFNMGYKKHCSHLVRWHTFSVLGWLGIVPPLASDSQSSVGSGFRGEGVDRAAVSVHLSSLSEWFPVFGLPFSWLPCQMLSGVSSVQDTPCLVRRKFSVPVWLYQQAEFAVISSYYYVNIPYCISLPTSSFPCGSALGHTYTLMALNTHFFFEDHQ